MRFKFVALVLLAIVVSATARTYGRATGWSEAQGCLSIGDGSYRLAKDGRADVTVRLDPSASAPTVRIGMAETADEADLVLVDDGNTAPACPPAAKAVRIDDSATTPDIVIGFAAEADADYRLFVRSRWITPESAAALFAASKVPPRKLANRSE